MCRALGGDHRVLGPLQHKKVEFLYLWVPLTGSIGILGGSCVVISEVIISKVTILVTLIAGLLTPLRTTHEPPSTGITGQYDEEVVGPLYTL